MCWIGLNAIPSVTARRFHILLEHFSSAEEIWQASLSDLQAVQPFCAFAEEFVEARSAIDLELEKKRMRALGLDLITIADATYPKPLRKIEVPPAVLNFKGSLTHKDELAISIVGTRKPSPYGRMITEKISSELAKMGFTIVSGMALGVDTAAHQGALKAGGRTLAVMGGGFAKIYPSENRKLVDKIARSGAVLTEYAVETKPDRWTFPQRNRIISGLSRGVIVIEAPEKSGALITARNAAEQGREVFVVPGPINDDSHLGSHTLIQKGAKLITRVDDVLNEFADLKLTLGSKQTGQAKEKISLSEPESLIYELLSFDPIHFNDVVEQSKQSTSDVSFALLQLVMKNLVKELEGKRYAKLP